MRGIPRATDAALVRFANCADMLRHLRAAAIRSRSSSGYAFAGGGVAGAPAAASGAAAPQAVGQAGVSGPYSGTNDAVVGVDEPDIIKTDGQRIVTVIGGVLRVVDARTGQLTGVLNLSATPGFYGAEPVNLLLAGDHALVLVQQGYPVVGPLPYGASGAGTPGTVPQTGSEPRQSQVPMPISGPRLLLVDLSGVTPRIISQYTIDGSLVDARLVGSVARVVIQSQPRVFLPMEPAHSPRVAGGVASWLPRYSVTGQGTRQIGRVSCANVSHPVTASYTATSMLTVLTFDLSAGILGSGQPVTILGNGGTVYSNGSSLYIANGEQWLQPLSEPVQGGAAQMALPPQYTAVYKFGISGAGPPVFEAAGTVPGWLLGAPGMAQYSLSDFGGVLRVATTSGAGFGGWSALSQRSAVYDLEQVGSRLLVVGKVGGLGAGEQIYAVRFEGPVGYVVTYRQVDPLYTLDLADPAQPRVVGELMLRGYSAYLDQIEPARLIGVGQGTTSFGETTGTQISLFDTSDPAAPVRLAVYHVRFAHSEAEFDPHAFLYWAPTRTLVLPVQLPFPVYPVPEPAPPASGQPQPVPQPAWPASGAIIMRVGDHSLTRIGMITQPAVPGWQGGAQIQRSLVIGDTLWTLSQAGLKANNLSTLAPLVWVPFGSPAAPRPLPGSPTM